MSVEYKIVVLWVHEFILYLCLAWGPDFLPGVKLKYNITFPKTVESKNELPVPALA